MVFRSPAWVPQLPFAPPDSIPISEFMFNEEYGRRPEEESKPPFTCGLSGKEYSVPEVKERVDLLARGIAKALGWSASSGSEWDKVVSIFSVNTIDALTVSWAVQRLNGISSPASAAYSASELAYQLKDSGSKAIFTCVPLLETAARAAREVDISEDRIFMLPLPAQVGGENGEEENFASVDKLICLGEGESPPLVPKWGQGQGARQTAFLCYSSGTSGLPKGVMISHRNVIANTLQIATYERVFRGKRKSGSREYLDVLLGLLPQSHIYGLVAVCHASVYRGDQVIVLPKFEMESFLSSIQTYKINTLFLVPPIVILMNKNQELCRKFDMSSVTSIFTGAAPLGAETARALQEQYPSWAIRQGYGLTETCTVVCSSSTEDIDFGSSGSLLPGIEAKIMNADGREITELDQPGELWVKSPTVVLGYLNKPEANKETFTDGWMHTGDEVLVRRSPAGNEHLWIVDRLKELIKVKGHQVAPAELEAHLLDHPAVADCAVIAVPDESAGEVPKAFVVRSKEIGLEDNERMVIRDIKRHVERHKARHKWLKGGVEFIDVIPKSASGKIFRRMLKDREKENRRQKGAKI